MTSLLLLALASLIAWVSNHALVQQFNYSQKIFYERQRHDVFLTLQRSADSMRQIASVIASSSTLRSALLAADVSSIEASLKSQWPTLQLDAGIDDVSIYNKDMVKIVSIGQMTSDTGKELGVDWLKSVIEMEQPDTKLLCHHECRQYMAVPILVKGTNAGVVMVSRSLADVTRYMQKSSGSEIALLVRSKKHPDKAERYIANWNSTIVALTHESSSFPLIEGISNSASFENINGKVYRYSESGREYEVIAIPIEGEGDEVDDHSGYFVLISNVTDQVKSISQTTRTVLLIALGGWIAAEILLFFILRYRMNRLKNISQKLPFLANRRYNVMRSELAPSRSFFQDEIDVLESTAIDLEIKLEELEIEVSKRGTELEARVRELARERDFVSGLFNTAQVLIVIHDRCGNITLANHFCQAITGLSEQELKKSTFQQLFAADLDLVRIDEFFDNGGQQESDVASSDGEVKVIVWYHTPLQYEELGRQELISVGVDITDRKLAERRLAWLANRDPLTELYNRRFFKEALQRAVIPGAFGAVLYLDLDRFKEVNEASGHQSGDQLLRAVATALADLSHGNIVARLGGDEFAILLENASEQTATEMAQRIADRLEQKTLSIEGRVHRASASIGVALYPDNGDHPDELMANADYAMYRAKEDAGQRWHLLSPEQQGREELKQRIYWVENIRNALLNNQFELMVQPIFRLSDLNVQHYELLLRLKDENGIYLSPAIFIPIAERSGQIVAIDRWVLSNGIGLISRLSSKNAVLAVNLSGQSLHDTGLTDFMKREFDRHQVEPKRLIIEVTETAAVTDFTAARGVLESIRMLGCQVALDDFGVGFSSFYYLGQLPADYIKIDGSFIRALPDSEENQLIVKAIADIARGMGKKIVAEFVDKESILPYLEKYKIDYVQGYYLGRPTTISDAGFG
ncbi:EAL domain-containing protein [Salinicola peritrichatus]|uniref:bifunctional diguanylate cyclase/phosphodiesterase n=1 Tax=Salinicola peritrichatus TaxID=1267424 RepID=UPI0013A62D15|nr:EAL domain-containing protein [Salinicola peritrichatus]